MVTGPTSMARNPCGLRSSSSSRSSFQKVRNFLAFFSIMLVKRRRHVREAFAHPLIAAGAETHGMPPPLMRHFVGRNHFPVAAVAPIDAKLVANRRVEVIANGNPDQSGPGLTEAAGGLLRQLQV